MDHFLTPLLALVIWTLFMWAFMYVRRIPAMQALKIDPQRYALEPNLSEQLPAKARWAADNYNHLHEQPVLFYVLMFYIYLVGADVRWVLILAWIYVLSRIIHSIVQVTVNNIMVRFSLFVFGTAILIIMAAYGAGYLLGGEIGARI